MSIDFPWPCPPSNETAPVWTGRGFRVDDALTPVLNFDVADSGWSDDLTAFHEENAGDDHCIDRASRRHALKQLRNHVSVSNPVVLEVGCSSGFFLDLLTKNWPEAMALGADYVRAPLQALAARRPEIPLLQFDLTRCPLPDASVDAVVLLNVLEHIADDVAAARHVARILKPGGIAVVEVPAGPHLYDVYDRVLMHERRYTIKGARRLMEAAGLEVIFASHLGALTYPAFQWVKKRNRRYLWAPAEQQQQIVAQAVQSTGRSRLMEVVFWLEDRLRHWLPLPFGIRCLLTCRKPQVGAARSLPMHRADRQQPHREAA